MDGSWDLGNNIYLSIYTNKYKVYKTQISVKLYLRTKLFRNILHHDYYDGNIVAIKDK